MRVFIAPLNWGLGHASRCVPLVRRHLAAGDEVVLGGDGDSLLLLRHHFPNLRVWLTNVFKYALRYNENAK